MWRVRERSLPWKWNKYYIFVCACGVTRRVGVCMRIHACGLAYPACNAYAPCYDDICGPSVCTTFFRHYLINGAIFGKTWLNIKCVFWFSPQVLSKIFLILRRIWRGETWNASTNFRKKAEISSLIKIRPVGVELFHADGQTDMKLTVAFRNFANVPNAIRNLTAGTTCKARFSIQHLKIFRTQHNKPRQPSR